MNRVIVIAMLLAACGAIAAGCGDRNAEGSIVYGSTPGEKGADPSDVISRMEIIPLETTDASLLSSEGSLMLFAGGDFLIFRRDILSDVARFDGNGKFLNTIGRRGGAGNEYRNPSNAWIDGGDLCIYSRPDRAVYSYSLDGAFVSKREAGVDAAQVIGDAGGGYWAYMGYGNGAMPERVVRLDGDGNAVAKFLPSQSRLSMSEMHDALIPQKDGVLVRETFNNVITSIDNRGNVTGKYVFDLGSNGLFREAHSKTEFGEAAGVLLSGDMTTLYAFFESARHSVAVASTQFNASRREPVFMVGVRSGRNWRWLYGGSRDKPNIFSATVKGLVGGDTMVLLAENRVIREFAAENPGIVGNLSVLDGLGETDDNPSVVLCKLK